MRRGLRTHLTVTISLFALVIISAISLLANLSVHIGFEKYVKQQQKARSQDIVDNLSRQYNSMTGKWETGYIHGVGMYALYEGYIIKISDAKGGVVWDAENHDMSLCRQIMDKITQRMQDKRPYLQGGMITHHYKLEQNGQTIGQVAIRSYGPYFLNENDFVFLNTLNVFLFVIGILSISASVIIGGILAKRISRPIIKTAHIATQISQGNYEARFDGKVRIRELNELAAATNHMAESLETQESLRKRLTTDVAHELRTPLTAISSHLEAMIEGVWQPTAERLQSCYEEIGRISGLVADLEKLSEIEDEDWILQKVPFDLLELAHVVSRNLESEGIKKGIRIDVDGTSTVITADRDRMSQVITNLLSNAIKYTPEKGSVTITVEDGSETGVLTVTDNGIGIPEDQLPYIFERFYRTDSSRSRKTGGAGIGLAIVKSIVNAHNGTIEVVSDAHQGSSFIVTLPKEV
ncbi:MAG: two-component sensor histidine kinase [Clostridiales bacterium 43-6]|nr:MAG: two-component sensor histidine kinase [Clostridiales bacterium 43-6]